MFINVKIKSLSLLNLPGIIVMIHNLEIITQEALTKYQDSETRLGRMYLVVRTYLLPEYDN